MFQVGSQCGLKPDEVLDMSFDVVQAYIRGYSDRLLDQQILAVTAGYWSGYYSNAKHPTKVSKVIAQLYKGHKKDQKGTITKPKAEVDVDAFLEREQAFNEKLKKGGSVEHG